MGEKTGNQVIPKREAPLRTVPSLIDAHLFEPLDLEVRQIVVFDGIADLKRVAADFAVFDVGVAVNREVEDHRNLFSARGTGEEVFHGEYGTACSWHMQLLSEIRSIEQRRSYHLGRTTRSSEPIHMALRPPTKQRGLNSPYEARGKSEITNVKSEPRYNRQDLTPIVILSGKSSAPRSSNTDEVMG